MASNGKHVASTAPRVLLVEDEDRDARVMHEELGSWLQLIRVRSFGEGRDSNLEGLSGVLLDLKLDLPYTGFDLLRVYRDRGFAGPIVILTGYFGEDVTAAARRLGANLVLEKGRTEAFHAIRKLFGAPDALPRSPLR